MKITVKLFATLRENREKVAIHDIDEGTTPKDIIEGLDIPLKDVAIIMVNGRRVDEDAEMKDGDVLALFPPVGGG
ncbi:Molybdopterin converting factor, small subunit [Dethiosulfatibacter aminovorans DSM 17477]|uniref:Molybdopterin converting factor, small subunit n=1 Tax=Dethiosulfatibacter aminovorans DSM 17477 TaxID=1121476 RepID=A0A1M6BWK7_9FIRM|nr:MoaD/ThiS family protein [Dethiosulfatibacter aminovorans]SHI53166.1 Molybdopterin converting factor, small subunit [Dethiosulfatibacter aminovorans DSM 17477]